MLLSSKLSREEFCYLIHRRTIERCSFPTFDINHVIVLQKESSCVRHTFKIPFARMEIQVQESLLQNEKKRIPKIGIVVDCNEVILFSLRHAFDIMKINSFQNEPRSRLHISLQSDHSQIPKHMCVCRIISLGFELLVPIRYVINYVKSLPPFSNSLREMLFSSYIF